MQRNITNSMTKLSVVISTRNRPNKLLKALRSIQDQDFSDWNAVVVGDHCDDSTKKAIAILGDSRIVYINTDRCYGLEDHGSTPKNIGIENSSGEYIAYLDDDDIFLPSHLSSSVRFLDENPQIDLVYGCSRVHKFINPERSIIRDRQFDKIAHDKSPFINTCEIVHRRELLKKTGGWRTVGYYNDYDFLKRVSEVGAIAHSPHLAATQHFDYKSVIEMEKRRLRRNRMYPPRVSIIVGVRNRERHLEACLKSLNSQSASKNDYEVIVVDQGSSGPSSFFAGRILYIALNDFYPYHRGWVNNVGAKHSLGDLLCFLDCDCVVSPDFVETILNNTQSEKYLIRLKTKLLDQSNTELYFSSEISLPEAFSRGNINPTVTALGSGTCVPKDIFYEIRGFDEKYDKGWGFEDVDLYERLLSYGCKIIGENIEPKQLHLWHTTSGHEKIHRGDHYRYYKEKSGLRGRNIKEYIYRNCAIDWGELKREVEF